MKKKHAFLINSLLAGLERLAFSAASALLAAASCNLAYGMTAGGVNSGASRSRGFGVIMTESCNRRKAIQFGKKCFFKVTGYINVWN